MTLLASSTAAICFPSLSESVSILAVVEEDISARDGENIEEVGEGDTWYLMCDRVPLAAAPQAHMYAPR